MSADISFIHPDARAALHNVFVQANLKPVIVQTEGGVAASAGTHLEAGTYTDDDGNEHSYSACVDFSVHQLATRLSDGADVRMDEVHIKWFLEHLAEFGFCAWYRTPDEGFSASHIHAVCAMVHMEPICQNQVIDFVNDRTGLRGHVLETFWMANEKQDSLIVSLFVLSNPEAAHRLPAKYQGALT